MWALALQEPSSPETVPHVLAACIFPPHGRCAMLFSSPERAEEAARRQPAWKVVIEIGNVAGLLLILDYVRSCGDGHVAFDIVFKEDGGAAGKFFTLDSMVAALRFWYHVGEDRDDVRPGT
jgi:hypothetical protein